MQAKDVLQSLAEKADIRINGNRPWDVQVHNENLYRRVLGQGTLGLGEAYMDGWWDCERMDVMIEKALNARVDGRISGNLPTLLHVAAQKLFNLQSVARAGIVAERHYNAERAMFETMLDPYMQYSCAYWRALPDQAAAPADLAAAQSNKMELICRKLKLEEGQSVLDIGCGWGGLARYMAEHYGVRVTGITVSDEQLSYAQEHAAGLPVDFKLMDYRSLDGKYDRVVSVGMFEHVGRKNYAAFMDVVRRCLKPEGLFLLHTLGSDGGGSGADPWLTKYIFPNGILPSTTSLMRAAQGRFIMEDWQNFGAFYDPTLLVWHKNFEKGCLEGKFRCDERMRRMYEYYLLSCAGASRARGFQLWQVVFSPRGVPGGYERP